MDRIYFGDNQFFGINHMSEEKAREQTMRFQSIEAVAETLHHAYAAGVPGFMCTTHERIAELIGHIDSEPAKWDGLRFLPGMPYAHKYANAVTELGYFDALRKFLPSSGKLDAAIKGGKALLTRDVESVMMLLVDAEMKMFEGRETPIIFLQNIVTDLILGLGYNEAFRMFSDYVAKKYKAEAGFFTMNLPRLLEALDSVGVSRPIVCANVNRIAFRMPGGIEAYRTATDRWPARVIAMSVMASGAIPPREAVEWVVGEPYVESIVFGASRRANIEQTIELIRDADRHRG